MCQVCLELHLLLMLRLFDSMTMPELVSPAVQVQWENDYIGSSVEARVADALSVAANPRTPADKEAVKLAMAKVAEVKERSRKGNSKTRTCDNMRRLDLTLLPALFFTLSKFGMDRWAPDILGDPKSAYNMAQQDIAVLTFKSLALSHTYRKHTPNLDYITDDSLLNKMYLHYIFHYMRRKVKDELRDPGTARRKRDQNNMGKRQGDVSTVRLGQYGV